MDFTVEIKYMYLKFLSQPVYMPSETRGFFSTKGDKRRLQAQVESVKAGNLFTPLLNAAIEKKNMS